MKDWYSYVIKYRASDNLVHSHKWRTIVTNFEGLRLKAYQDSVGVWTVGWGHTGSDVFPDTIITLEEAEILLKQDVEEFEEQVNDLVEVPMTQYQFDSILSFTFNLGYGNLQSSTLLKRLNCKDYVSVPKEMNRWVYAGGKKLNGLIKRRLQESRMFGGYDIVL